MNAAENAQQDFDIDYADLVRKQGLDNQAITCLAIARLAVLLLSFKRVASWLGRFNLETSSQPLQNPQQALLVAWAVAYYAKSVPWRSECLEQALAAKWMLRRKRISSTLYFGTFYNGYALEAHAWVRCGDLIVTGDKGHGQFTATAMYGDKS